MTTRPSFKTSAGGPAATAALAAAATAALLVTVLQTSPALAYTLGGYRAQFNTQTFFVNPNFGTDPRAGTPAQQITAIRNGAFDWNNQAAYLWTYGGQTAVNAVNLNDGVNAVFYVLNSNNQFGAGAITIGNVDANGFITAFDIQFYDRTPPPVWDFLWYGLGQVPPATDSDLWSVAAHEFGHALGMNHTQLQDPTVTMYPFTTPGTIVQRVLHPDDIAGVQAIYGPPPYAPGVLVACAPNQNAPIGAVTQLAGQWRITNTGNVPDRYNFQLNDNRGWLLPIAPAQTPALQPGATFTLAPQPTVNIPNGVANGTIDNLQFAAMSAGNAAVAGNCASQVTARQAAYATAAQLGGAPSGLAWDAANNLYVAVYAAGTVVKVPPGGGGPFPIVINGLTQPTGLCLGPNGNLFVTDMTGGVYEWMLPGGGLVIIAAPGTFLAPMDLAFCGADLLVADKGQGKVYALPGAGGGAQLPIQPVFYSGPYPDLFGIALGPMGLLATGGMSGAIFQTPLGTTVPIPWGATGGNAMGIAIDSGGLVYVAEGQMGGDIDVFPAGGGAPGAMIPNTTSGFTWMAFSQNQQAHAPNVADTYLYTSNTGNVGPANPAQFNVVMTDVAVAVGGANGSLLPSMATCPLGPAAAVYAAAPAISGQGPSGLAFMPNGSGLLFVADQNAGTIDWVARGGGQGGSVLTGLPGPRGITLTGTPGGPPTDMRLFVALANGSIAEYGFNPFGFVRYTCPPGAFADPVDMVWCGSDLFVTDRGARTLYLVPNAAGGPSAPLVYQAGFPDLFGVAIDPAGSIHVTLGSTPQVARLGAPGAGWTVVGTAPGARSMQGISFDQSGGFYVADGVSGNIHAFPPGGGMPSATSYNKCSGETWMAHGFGVGTPMVMDPDLFYTSTGAGGPQNPYRLAVSRIGFPGSPRGKRLPDFACSAQAPAALEDPDLAGLFGGAPLTTALLASVPNPVRSTAQILYSLEESGNVRLTVFDAAGREVSRLVDAARPAGRYATTWNGRDARGRQLAAGAYFYRLEGAGRPLTRKLILVR